MLDLHACGVDFCQFTPFFVVSMHAVGFDASFVVPVMIIEHSLSLASL